MENSSKVNKIRYYPFTTQPFSLIPWPECLPIDSSLEVGLSGGVDSTALLSMLANARLHSKYTLSAVHVHHGLSPHADKWAEHCQRLCQILDIPLRIEKVSVTNTGEGIEAAARNARYEIYQRTQANVIVLAQHLDDQIETLLLQILRGGGVHALASMPTWRNLNETKNIWRPLLQISRQSLLNYISDQRLNWVEDESNTNTQYLRNWVRKLLIPVIAEHQPNYKQALIRCAQQMADAANILDETTAIDILHTTSPHQRLNLNLWAQLSASRQRLLLLRWAEMCKLGTPSAKSLEEYQRQLHYAKPDSSPVWQLPYGFGHRYKTELWPEKKQILATPVIKLNTNKTRTIPEWGGTLSWQQDCYGIDSNLFLKQKLQIQPISADTWITVRGIRRTLKKLFQENNIPPFLRRRWPILTDIDTGAIIALPSIAVDDYYQTEHGWLAHWHAKTP